MASGLKNSSATQVVVTGTSSSNSTEIMNFTIPGAGTWIIDYFVTMQGVPSLSNTVYAGLFNSSNALVANSQMTAPQANGLVNFTANKTTLVTTTGPTTFKLKGWGSNTSNPQPQTQYVVPASAAGVVFISDSGTTGAVGATGPRGATGATGDKGPAGPTGATGAQGPVGSPGATGPAGPKGDIGIAGAKGDKGLTGDKGPAGAQGPVGATGAPGATGPAGAAGARGDVGAQGPGRPVTVMNRAPNANEGNVGDIWYQTY